MSDDFIANYAREQERKRAGASTLNAIGTNPERAARAQRLGQRLGIPPQAVMADPGYETQARQVEIGAVLDRSPATASFMADQANAEIAHDQVEGLGSLEQMLRRGVRGGADVIGNIGKSLYAGIPRTSAGVVGLTEALGDVAGALNPFAAAERGLTAAGVLRGPTSEQNRRQTSQAYRQRLMSQAAALRPQTDNALASAAYSGLESVVPSILGIAATLASGGSATPAAALLAAPVGGEAYGQARDAGKGLAPSLIYGVGQGGAEAVGERIGLGPLFDGLKVGSPFLQTFIKTQISEQLGEQATTVLQDFNDWVTLNPEKTVGQFLEERPNAALQTAIATAVGSAATTTGVYTGNRATQELLSFADRRANAQASRVRAEQFNEAADAAAGNPVRERSPERFEQFLKAAAGDEQVFVPAEQVASFFQSNPELDQWMDEWDIRDQVNAALVSGADVVFDQSTYLARVAGTPAHEAWKNEIRHGLDAMSIREAEEFERNGEESLRASFDAAVSVAESEAAALAPEARVADDLFSQLRAAGYTADAARTQAALAARAFARRAERSPQRFADAYAAYESAGLTVQQEFPQVIRENLDRIDVMIEALRKGRAAPTDRRMFGRSLMEFLSQEGGVIDTGGELQALGADSWHRPKQGGRAFRRRFIRSAEQGGNAYAPDQAALRAVEAGYLPEGATGNDLFEAVREELAGRPVYSQGFERNTTAINNAAALNELEQLISQLDGVTLESSNQEIKAALERAAAAAPGYQEATLESSGLIDSRLKQEADSIVLPEGATGNDDAFKKKAALNVAAGNIGALSSFRPGNTEVDRAFDWAFDNGRTDVMSRIVARAEDTLREDEADFENGTATYRKNKADSIAESQKWVGNLRSDLQQKQRERAAPGYQATGETFSQNTPFTGPRGQISFSNGQAAIRLFESRDLSTFSHEFGHLTLEMLIDDASDPNASPEVLADMQTVLDWFSREAGQTITVDDIGVDQHELWARGSERYLMEGKAPSLALRDVFRTFSTWLKSIYKILQNLNAPITDDVRAVMDRLLASDAEIVQARQVSGEETGVDVLRQQGMTDAEAAAYEKAVARVRSDAESDLLGKVMGAIRRRVTKEWNDAAEEIRPNITAEVDAMPDIAAIEFITTTRTPLDRETVVAMLGDEAGLSLLPKRVPPIFSATGGQHPDMVAEAAGYRSGQELLNGLMDHAAEKRRLVEAGDKRSVRQTRIEERVREALLDRFGDVLNDGSIEQEAIDAIHSERYGDILAMDLNVLARRTGNTPAPIQALRQWARERISSRPVRDARPGRYLRAERSASTAVQKALAAGNRDEAFRQKQAQVISNVLYVAAREAERFSEAAIDRMRKLGRGKNPSIHVDYMEQIDALLEQYELKEVSGRTVQRRKSLAAFKEERERAGEPVNIPAEVLASLDKTNLADLTVDELRGLDETVKHLVHLGRMKTKLIVMGEERDLNRVGDDVLKRSAYIKDRKISETPGAQTWIEERRADFDGAVAALRKMQEIARRMDGSDTEGPFHDNLDRPSMEAANKKSRLAADFYTPIKAAVDAIPKQIKARWMDTLSDHPFVNPRTGLPLEGMKRADLIAVALNVGTLSNFESMAKGWGVISPDADAVAVSAARLGMIQWLNERLDANEWAYVQAWWDAHERLRSEYFAAARKVEGFEPDAVDAEPVTTPAGVLKGGYAPLIYHPDFDEATLQRNQMDDADPLGGLGRSGPRPDNGATISRTGYSGPVDLRMDSHRMVADKHLTYAAYAEFITNALKFINHHPIREAVITKLGKPVYDTIRPWLESQVRNDTVNDPNAKFWQKILRQSRSNIVMASLLGSVTVMLAQGSGLVASAAKVGPVKLARGVAAEIRLNRMTGGDGVFDYVASKSDFMRLRLEEGELDRDIKFALAKSQAGVKLKAEAATLAGKAIAAVDFYLVSGPTWLGVYESEIEAGRDEADAVYAADMAVSTTQGGGRARDMSGFMRGNDALKMGTIAFGWASAFENMVSGAVFDIRHGQNVGRNVGMLSALLIVMPLMDAVMSGDLPDPGEDDEETLANYADWFMRNVVTNLFVGIPFVRDLSSWVEREWAGEYTGTIGQTPNGRILSEFTRLYKDIKAAVDDEKDVSHRWPAHVISAVGYSFGIPGTSQAARATNYGLDVAEGDQNPDTALDVVTGVVRGPQKEQR